MAWRASSRGTRCRVLGRQGDGGELRGLLTGMRHSHRASPNEGLEPTAGSVRYASAAGSRLRPGVCAVHAVMLGSESLPSRCSWSRRTREAQGRHREVGSEGSVERRCGARDTNRIRGVVQPGRAGTQQQSPPSTIGLYFINPASMHRRYDSLPREICRVSCLRTEGGGILPDRPAEVSRGHSRHARAC